MSANRDSTVEMNVKETTNLSWSGMSKHLNTQSTGQLDPKFQSTSHSQGQGGVSRSKSIDLRVGAVVTCVLPNGHLIVSGRQEVLVNFELRELIIAGIVQPEISPQTTASLTTRSPRHGFPMVAAGVSWRSSNPAGDSNSTTS